MARSRLPIGIRSLREIRERNCYYVDKTAHLARLADEDRKRSQPRQLFAEARDSAEIPTTDDGAA